MTEHEAQPDQRENPRECNRCDEHAVSEPCAGQSDEAVQTSWAVEMRISADQLQPGFRTGNAHNRKRGDRETEHCGQSPAPGATFPPASHERRQTEAQLWLGKQDRYDETRRTTGPPPVPPAAVGDCDAQGADTIPLP